MRKKPPLKGLDETLLAQRNEIRKVLGRQWWQALLFSAGRLAFDYLCLLAALRATGSRPRPSLILVAYAVAGIVGMIPATPGGLGLVEASLTGLLVLAEVNSSQAVLATLTLPARLILGAAVCRTYRLRPVPDPVSKPRVPQRSRPQRQPDTGLHAEADRFELSLVGARCGRYPGAVVNDGGVTRPSWLSVIEDEDALAVPADMVVCDKDMPGMPDEYPELVAVGLVVAHHRVGLG